MTFFRYIVIQLLAYVIDMGSFLFILHFELTGAIAANVVAKLAAGGFAFVSHRSFTFDVARSDAIGKQAARYFFVLAMNVPIASAILSVMLLRIPTPVVAKFLSDVLCVAISYILSKHFIFNKKAHLLDNSSSRIVK